MAKRLRSKIHQPKIYRGRVRFAMFMSMVVFAAIGFRLYVLQILNYSALVEEARTQYSRVFKVPAHRGEIRDRNNIILASSVFRDTIYVDPSKFGKQEFEITRVIANELGLDRRDLVKKIGNKVTAVARRLPSERCSEILKEIDKVKPKPAFGAVFSRKESVRLYPKGSVGANLLGFCIQEKDGSDDLGASGLEKAYDELLRGKDQSQSVLVSRFGQAIEPLDEEVVHAAYGNTVELTIDSKIQYYAESALAKRVTETGGKAGACVVMNPRNGDLLAVASCPSFVPDDPSTRQPNGMLNRAFENAIEPGSVMKIFTYSTATELNLFSPAEMVDCGGKSFTFTEGRVSRTIVDFHGMGVVPFQEAFFESSNVAAVRLGLRIPDIDFYDILSRLQFAERTGLNFPGEARGHLTSLPWGFMTRTSVPFGYEVSANSVQMAACIAAIANGGVKMAPRLIRRLVSSRGKTMEEFKPHEAGRMFNEATAQLMTELMEGVVLEGTGKTAAVNGYRVAGKTGTTRKTGRADDDRAYLASFAGFLPVSNPQLVIYCWIDEPQKTTDSYTGGRAAAPVFQEVAAQAVRVLEIKPDGEFLPEPTDKASGNVVESAPETSDFVDTFAEASSEPVVESPFTLDTTSVPAYDPMVADAMGLMPDLMGMTKREVTQQIAEIRRKHPSVKISPRFYGNGIVVRQDPLPMSPLNLAEECFIQFGKPGDMQDVQPIGNAEPLP